MPNNLPMISVTKAAKFLGVSPDTLRNWEKTGKLVPSRTQGGARRYKLPLLEELKKQLNITPRISKRSFLTISKAASILGLSADTLRNWEKRGLLKPERTKGGARRYAISDIKQLKEEMAPKVVATAQDPKLLEQIPLIVEKPQPEMKNSAPDQEKSSFFAKLRSFIGVSAFFFTFLVLILMESQINLLDSKYTNLLNERVGELRGQIQALAKTVESQQSAIFQIQARQDTLGVSTQQENFHTTTLVSVNWGALTSNLVPKSGQSLTLGTTESPFSQVFAQSAQVNNLSVTNSFTSGATLNPSTTGTLDLGSQSSAWRNLYLSKDANISGKASIGSDLNVSGSSNLGSLNLTGDFSQKNSLFITSGNSIYSNGTLFLQNSDSSQLIDMFAGKVTFNKDGHIKAEEILVSGFKVRAGKISGSGTITDGEDEVEIPNSLVSQTSRILLTPTSQSSLVLAVVEKVDGEKFVVKSSQVTAEDLTFDYFLINEEI